MGPIFSCFPSRNGVVAATKEVLTVDAFMRSESDALGRGGFADVCSAIIVNTNEWFAIKRVDKVCDEDLVQYFYAYSGS
jgi:hypothetical protein